MLPPLMPESRVYGLFASLSARTGVACEPPVERKRPFSNGLKEVGFEDQLPPEEAVDRQFRPVYSTYGYSAVSAASCVGVTFRGIPGGVINISSCHITCYDNRAC